jgi:hypothetical protein
MGLCASENLPCYFFNVISRIALYLFAVTLCIPTIPYRIRFYGNHVIGFDEEWYRNNEPSLIMLLTFSEEFLNSNSSKTKL